MSWGWSGEREGGVSVLARSANRPPVADLCPQLLPSLVPGDVVKVRLNSYNTFYITLRSHFLFKGLSIQIHVE